MPKLSPKVPKGGRNGIQREADRPSEPSKIDKKLSLFCKDFLGGPNVPSMQVFGAIFGNFGPHFGINILCFSDLFLGCFFSSIFMWFWIRLGSHLASFWVASFTTFPDFAKNARPYENVVNNSRIEGPAPRKTTKTPSKND